MLPRFGIAVLTVVCSLTATISFAGDTNCLKNDNGFNICVGDQVIDARNMVSRVLEIFYNGKTKVQFDGYTAPDNRKLSDLAAAQDCVNGICVGDRVIDDPKKPMGTVKLVFANNKVKVLFDEASATDTRLASQLSKISR